MLGQEPGVPLGRRKEGGNATTKSKGNSVLIRKKMECSRGVILIICTGGEQWASEVLGMIFKVVETVEVPKENVSAA